MKVEECLKGVAKRVLLMMVMMVVVVVVVVVVFVRSY